MADTLITNLSNIASPDGTEEVAVNVPGAPDTDGKVTLANAAAYANSLLGNSAPLDVGTTTGTVAAGDDSRMSDARAPTAHASTHTNGTDDIQDATAAQKGLATSTQITKLDGIEAGADVTDAGNVAAAGAVMTSALGTGVATALAVNVGSAGAPVLLDGAGGTPSAINLGNGTALPVSGITSSTSTALGLGSIELGHASDTTIARSSAGNITVEGQTIYRAGGSLTGLPVEIVVACSDETTALTTGTAKVTFRMPHAMTVTSVRLQVNTAPTGSVIIVDVKEAGTTIFSTKPQIAVSAFTSVGGAVPGTLSDTSLADDAEITINLDQIGSTIAGKGLKVTLIGTRS